MALATKPNNATGRRKTAVANVTLNEGSGNIHINGRTFEDYFPTLDVQNVVLSPLQITKLAKKFDISVQVKGGGTQSQATAISHAISRALLLVDPELRATLKAAGHLRRDPRMKERKKAGQPGARKNFQFSKR